MLNDLRTYIRANRERIERLVSRGEILGLVLCVAGVFMMMQHMSLSSTMLVAGISLLAFVYIFHGNFLAEIFGLQQAGMLISVLRASYIALATATLGILFRLQGWPGGRIMLMAGCALSGALFLFLIYKLYLGKLEDEQQRMLINNLIVRMLPAILIVAFLVTLAMRF